MNWSVLFDVASEVLDGFRWFWKCPLTRPTPLDRPFGFTLVFANNAHAHRQLLHTGSHEKV